MQIVCSHLACARSSSKNDICVRLCLLNQKTESTCDDVMKLKIKVMFVWNGMTCVALLSLVLRRIKHVSELDNRSEELKYTGCLTRNRIVVDFCSNARKEGSDCTAQRHNNETDKYMMNHTALCRKTPSPSQNNQMQKSVQYNAVNEARNKQLDKEGCSFSKSGSVFDVRCCPSAGHAELHPDQPP